jgi:hypothetical protein
MFYKHHSNLGAEQMSVVKDTKISNVYGNAILNVIRYHIWIISLVKYVVQI